MPPLHASLHRLSLSTKPRIRPYESIKRGEAYLWPSTSGRRSITSSMTRGARLSTKNDDDEAQIKKSQAQLDELEGDFKAAPEIDFAKQDALEAKKYRARATEFMDTLRVVPESPSYFTVKPTFTDSLLHLQSLLRRYMMLPTVKASEAPPILWIQLDAYKGATKEPVRATQFKKLQDILKRLNIIHPQIMPTAVRKALDSWARDVQPFFNRPAAIPIDEFGRAAAIGKRKASAAKVWVVEGDGQFLINGKPMHHVFARAHDRESVIWALKSTQRTDKYNIFALVHGGGTTGQAEALTLAVGKALIAHEPGLKPALRRAGCVTRDPRRVERKKPGHYKAREMPQWVKR